MSVGYGAATSRTEAPVSTAPSEDAQPKRKSGLLGNVVKLTITIVGSAFVLWQAGLANALQALAGADWRWVALAAASAVVAMVINVKRWQVMLHGQGDDAKLTTLIRLYLIAMFFNNLLPSRFAGDAVRAYGASVNLTTKTRSVAAVVMDRFIGAISVLLLGVIAVAINPSVLPDQFQQVRQLLVVGLIVGVVVAVLLIVPTPLHGSARHLLPLFERLPWIGKKFGRRVQSVVEAVQAYTGKPGLVAWALVISMVANGLSIVNIYLYAMAVGADVHLTEAAVVVPVVLAVGLLPSINGLGTIEVAFVLLLGSMGVSSDLALAVAILRRLVLLGQSLVGGVLYSAKRFG